MLTRKAYLTVLLLLTPLMALIALTAYSTASPEKTPLTTSLPDSFPPLIDQEYLELQASLKEEEAKRALLLLEQSILLRKLYQAEEELFLAMTLYCEARGEGVIGQELVAGVVLQRKKSKAWPDNIIDVVLQPRINHFRSKE